MTAGTPRPPARPSPRTGTVRACALVAAGGAVGTAVRALASDALPPGASGIPWSTLAINLLGAFLLGLLLAVLLDGRAGSPRGPGLRGDAWLACGTGVLGGFTTYSAFVLQSGELAGDGRTAVAAAYAVGSVALGLVAAGVGLAAGDVATRRRRRDGTGDDA